MGISVFEAAAVYDFHTMQNPSVPIHSIVFDTDRYSVGFCTCNKGKAEVIGSYSLGENHNFIEDMINEISKIANGSTKDSIRASFTEQMNTLNKQMRRYLRSERQVDGIAMQFLDLSIHCAEVEKAFQVAKEKWDNVFLQLDTLWNTSQFDEEDVRIIMVGTSANWYLIEFYIRNQLSFDPFLVDERFVNVFYKDNAEQIVEIGQRLFEKTNVLGMDIHLVLMDTEHRRQKILLAEKEQSKQHLERPQYVAPIFIAKNERLELEVNTIRRQIQLPYDIHTSYGDVIEIGICIKEDTPILCIRRCNASTCIYEIPIKL